MVLNQKPIVTEVESWHLKIQLRSEYLWRQFFWRGSLSFWHQKTWPRAEEPVSLTHAQWFPLYLKMSLVALSQSVCFVLCWVFISSLSARPSIGSPHALQWWCLESWLWVLWAEAGAQSGCKFIAGFQSPGHLGVQLESGCLEQDSEEGTGALRRVKPRDRASPVIHLFTKCHLSVMYWCRWKNSNLCFHFEFPDCSDYECRSHLWFFSRTWY